MIITCNECNSSFNVGDGLIKETGSKVRCSKCDCVFIAYPQSPENDNVMDSVSKPASSVEDAGLDDFDSSVDDFLGPDESRKIEDSLEVADEDLELDLDFDHKTEQQKAGDELPDLGDFEDLVGLDDESVITDETGDGLEDLDLEKESTGELESQPTVEFEDSDLGLDFDQEAENKDGEEIAETVLEVDEAEELDLSDLELEIEGAPLMDEASAGESDDLELELDLGQENETVAGDEETGTDELDLSDLEEIIDQKELSVSELQPGDDLDDLDLDLDLEAETEPGAHADVTDELDLSDLEEIVETGEAPESPTNLEDTEEDLELDFGFQKEESTQNIGADVEAEDEDELDFSDLEQMLESEEITAAGAAAGTEVEELDIQFDNDEQTASSADAPATGDVGEAEQEDDLLDIEKMLEQEEDSTAQQSAMTADDDLELPLETEAALEDTSEESDSDLEFDFDLEASSQEEESLDKGEVADKRLEENLFESEDIDILDDSGFEEVEFQNGSGQVDAVTDDFATDEFTETDEEYNRTDVLPVDEDEFSEVAVKPKSRSKKPVLVIILLVLVAIGTIVIPNILGIKIPYISDIKIPYLSDLNLDIPFLSDLVNPEEQDISGNQRMTPMGNTISGRFIKNSQAGQLFVIRGKIKNEYEQPRSFVKVTGKLYQKGEKLAKTATVYCGNVLSDPELAQMDIATISKKMGNKFGAKKSNLKIKTGKTVPFMIVFDKLPRNLDEYTVEVAESSI